MNNITGVVKNLLIINVLIYFGTTLTTEMTAFDLTQYFKLYYPLSQDFMPVQLVTHMFMHGNITHLLFNMLSLFFLGPYVEKRMGSKRFLIFYLVCGFGAMLAHLGVNYYEFVNVPELLSSIPADQLENLLERGEFNNSVISSENASLVYGAMKGTVVGASGAIMGVTIAFALFFPNMKLMLLFPPIPIKAKYMAGVIIAIDLFSGVSRVSSGIAHFAHLGGALTGLILVYIWYSHIFKK